MDGQLIAFTGVAAGMVAMPGADFAVVVRNALDSRRAGWRPPSEWRAGCWCTPHWRSPGSRPCWSPCPRSSAPSNSWAGSICCTSASVRWSRPSAAGERPTAPRPPRPWHRPTVRPPARTAGRSLRQGFLTNALNPKAPVLFLSLLPQFVPAGEPALPRTLLLATMVVAMALVWFPAVALLVDHLGDWLRRPRVTRALEAVTGALLTTLGGILLVEVVLA